MMTWAWAAFGGLLIGIAASILLIFSGRIMGVSGILGGALQNPKTELLKGWRWEFLFGLLSGGIVIRILAPEQFVNTLITPTPILFLAGLLVGLGTRLGGGCTSGHGICGVSRFSMRSIVATIIFLVAGILTATFIRPWVIL